jgi:phospholipid/cholesterol/gamma-HCH transport system substrate-binding protein
MQVRPKDKKNILAAGIFTSLLCILTMASVFMLSKDSSLFTTKLLIHTEVQNVQNLKSGAAVQLKGVKVGTIQQIDFLDLDKIKITVGVNRDYQPWIKSDSYIAFRTQGVLGDKFLEILGGSVDSPNIVDNDFLATQESSQFDSFINKGEDILVVASRVLHKIDKALGTVEGNRIANILTNLESVTRNANLFIRDMDGKAIGTLTKNLSKATQSLDKTANSFSNISKQIEKGPGTLHSLIYDRSVHDDLRTLLEGSNRSKVLKYFIRETIKKSED